MRPPRSRGEMVSWGRREQAVLIFWVWPKHLWTERQPVSFAQSWDFSSAQVTSILFFFFFSIENNNFCEFGLTSFSAFWDEGDPKVYFLWQHHLRYISAQALVVDPLPLGWWRGQSWGRRVWGTLCPQFLSPAIPGIHPHGRARVGCKTGGGQTSTPRHLILRKTTSLGLSSSPVKWGD